MSECQSKCACGDICRRVDGHLQHQCPKCSYEQRGTAENVATAPATPAATPMAALPAKWRKECPHGAIGPYSQGLMDCAEELETALAAAAQPQRESEQPEQALREALLKVRSYNVDILAGRINYRPQDHIDVIDAALSPQTDSQEPR